jgi:hypothetical protein
MTPPTPPTTIDDLVPESGYRSREVALFVAQLGDQLRLLREDTRELTPDALGWQPAPGMNTIGMLLAHIAIVEVFWTQAGPLRMKEFETDSVLGIDLDHGDGMPLAEGSAPPAGLAGKNLAYFDDLLARGRSYLEEHARAVEDADLDFVVHRLRKDGTERRYTIRWVYYHLVEHFSGHYGQILLLKHQYRSAHPASSPPRS